MPQPQRFSRTKEAMMAMKVAMMILEIVAPTFIGLTICENRMHWRFLASAAVAAVLLLAVAFTFKSEEGEMDGFGITSELLAKAKQGSPNAVAELQKLERIHVKKCAKDITGSDKPRKLPPTLRAKVLKCANDFMPPVKTKQLLAQSAKELMQAAKTPEQKKDAQSVLAQAAGSSAKQSASTVRSAALARLSAKKHAAHGSK